MAGTAVAVRGKQQSTAVGFTIDLKKINYAAAAEVGKKYLKAVGAGEAFQRNFPGTEIQFKSGQWMFDRTTRLKAGTKLVVNVPNAIAAWVRWEDFVNKKGEDKRRPVYEGITFPALGQDPVERNTLGFDDEDEWETDDKTGRPIDPWKPILVFPCRYEDDEELHHIMLTNKSSNIAGYNMYMDVMAELRSRAGELPVIALSADKAESTVEKVVKGKKKKEKFVWDVPVFEIVDWVEAQDFDNPKNGGVEVTASDDDADLGEVETKSRKAKGKDKVEKASVKAKSRRHVEVDDEDEDEDEDEEDEAPRSRKASKPAKSNGKRRLVDEDEDEDI